FGAEEQLSAGSAAYVRAHREEISRNGLFMCNLDSYATRMGWGELIVNASDSLRDLMKDLYNRNDLYYVENTDTCPYTDQFPFAACGVPGCWISQKNCTSGIFFHHREDNTADVLDFVTAGRWVESSAELMGTLADLDELGSLKGIPEEIQKKVDEEFNAVYGGF
ncbi:MAG: M28 family peptidase, partial [Lentisphaeria bacterium]|nr:M28 family peptidase [Lentisphaeria bacterium]